jgi:hypothetical protein
MTPEETKHLLKLAGRMYQDARHLLNCSVGVLPYALSKLRVSTEEYNYEVMRLQNKKT